jgi:hypothetical protein
MERATNIARKLVGADERSVVPTQDGGDRGSLKHLWAMVVISIGIIIFGIVMAFSGWFEL